MFRRLSPRRAYRVDEAGAHDYRSAPAPVTPPAVPYAVYLADRAHRYRLLCFDLDAAAGPDVVDEDTARLVELLAEAGWRYLVCVSGPSAGRHVWTYVPDGVDAGPVAQLARALVAILPSLDAGMLHNPATGCARPPGAPHRHGGTSRIDPQYHPDPAAALAAFAAGTPADRVPLVVASLPPAVQQAARGLRAGRRHPRAVLVDDDGPRLDGPRRALSPAVAALVTSSPNAGDHSAHLWRVLIGAALARWNLADVADLVDDPAAVGLEHVRSQATAGGRQARTGAASAAVLTRQWTRAVERAAELPAGAAPDDADRDDDPQVRHVTAAVAAIQAAAEAMPWRWATQAGPADREALRAICRVALAACSLTVALDVRRWSTMTGYGRSTMAVAAARLCQSDPVDGPAWLALDTPANGRAAAVWQLLPPVAGDHVDQDDEPGSSSVDKGRTQGAARPPYATRTPLTHTLAAQSAHSSHDVWTPRGGLGHHTARTHAAILAGHHTVEELAQATGYTVATVRRHVARLVAVRLATGSTGRRVRPGRASLDAVAVRLGTAGAGEARRARHRLDRELRAWWDAEHEWRCKPRADKPRIPRQPSAPGQRALPVPAGPLAVYGRFPTRPGGRADYTTAAAIVRAQLDGVALVAA